MRSIMFAALLALGLMAVPAFAQDADGAENEGVEKEEKEAVKANVYEATVEGMTWGFSCVRAVKKTAAGLDGVDKVEVDFESKRMTLTMKEGKSLDEKTVKEAYAETKFSIKDFKQREEAEEGTDKDDAEKKDTGNLKATITGMMWGVGCVRAVKKTVSSLEGVDKVEVDFEAKTATITMKEGKTLSKDDLNKAFKDSRFECTKVESIEAEKKEDTEDTKEG